MTGVRSAPAQPRSAFHEPAAATAKALASSPRCRPPSEDTSTAENTPASTASRATAASETPRNASASRSPSVLPRCPLPRCPLPRCPFPDAADDTDAASVIAGQAEPVAAAEHGHDHPRVSRIVLDLAPEVLHMRVDRALVAFELVAPHLVDQLKPGVDPSGHGRQGDQDAPLGGRELDGRAVHGHGAPRLVDDQRPSAVAGDARLRRRRTAAA